MKMNTQSYVTVYVHPYIKQLVALLWIFPLQKLAPFTRVYAMESTKKKTNISERKPPYN